MNSLVKILPNIGELHREGFPDECSTQQDRPLSPPPSPLVNSGLQYFDPVWSDICPKDSVVLTVENDLMPYLEKALCALGLHVEARTSFITYVTASSFSHKHNQH